MCYYRGVKEGWLGLNKYFSIAREVSKLSDFKRIKIGCCIVLKHEVIATGYNTKKSHPLQAKLNHLRFTDHFDKCNHYLHSELRALISCKHMDLNRAELYVYREDRDGHIQMCRPCQACLYAIKQAGIKTIHYTTYDGFVKEVFQN